MSRDTSRTRHPRALLSQDGWSEAIPISGACAWGVAMLDLPEWPLLQDQEPLTLPLFRRQERGPFGVG